MKLFTITPCVVLTASLCCVLCFSACRHEGEMNPSTNAEKVCEGQNLTHKGIYLLNEGNWGSNKCMLDYFEFATGTYCRDVFGTINPYVTQGLGDVGNDLKIYGSRLYAVVNASNLIEIMDLNGKHITSLTLTNPRNIAFKDQYAYVSSYTNVVYRFDTAAVNILEICAVGPQPEGIEIVENTLFTANSGGYNYPNYDSTLSVVDLLSFKETRRLPVVVNPFLMKSDEHNQLWIISQGDYLANPSCLVCLNTQTLEVTDTIDIRVSDMWLDGDELYCIAQGSYKIVNVVSHEVTNSAFITDGTDSGIETPYGILVEPETKNVYITDVRQYVAPGKLYCYSAEGKRLWTVFTDDVPGHLTLVK